jgi:flagellar assembly factor FliW
MEIQTKQFGTVEIEDNQIVTMPGGMPGFHTMKRFVIIEREEIWPFCCFQSLDDPELSFYIMSPSLFMSDYQLDMRQAFREAGWEGDDPEDAKLYVIVNTSAGVPEKITANLIGPLVVNFRRQEADQLVLHNSPYSHKHRIFSESSPSSPQTAKPDGGREAGMIGG